jgi:hypothetical protein
MVRAVYRESKNCAQGYRWFDEELVCLQETMARCQVVMLDS